MVLHIIGQSYTKLMYDIADPCCMAIPLTLIHTYTRYSVDKFSFLLFNKYVYRGEGVGVSPKFYIICPLDIENE